MVQILFRFLTIIHDFQKRECQSELRVSTYPDCSTEGVITPVEVYPEDSTSYIQKSYNLHPQ